MLSFLLPKPLLVLCVLLAPGMLFHGEMGCVVLEPEVRGAAWVSSDISVCSSSKEYQGSVEIWRHPDQESSSCPAMLCASVSYVEKEESLLHTWQCGSRYVGGAISGRTLGRWQGV